LLLIPYSNYYYYYYYYYYDDDDDDDDDDNYDYYCKQPVEYPELCGLEDDALIKPSFTTTSGDATTTRRYRYLLAFNGMVYVLLVVVAGWGVVAVNLVLLVAAMVVVGLNALLHMAGRAKQKHLVNLYFKGQIHQALEVGGR